MTDKPLHYFRDLKGVVFSTQHPENYDSDPGYERVIPIPAALVTDELLADLWALYGASGRARRLIALRDALIAGLPKPEPRFVRVTIEAEAQATEDGFLRINVGPDTAVIDPDARNVTVETLADGGESDE